MHTTRARSTTQLASLASTALTTMTDLQSMHAARRRNKDTWLQICMFKQMHLGKFSTHTLTEAQKRVLQDRPNSSNLFFQLKLLSCAQKVTVTSMAAKQQSQMSNT